MLLVVHPPRMSHGCAEKRLGQLLHDHEVEHGEGRLTHVHGEKSFPQGERSEEVEREADGVGDAA